MVLGEEVLTMQNEFWAKSSGTSLVEHTNDVLQAVDILRKKKQGDIHDDWWLALQYAALLHDLGKIDPTFQAMLKKVKLDLPGIDIPHSLISLFLFRPELFSFSDPLIAQIIVSSVAFHHWRESFPDLLMGSRSYDITVKAEEFVEKDTEWSARCQKVARQLEGLAKRYRLNEKIIGINKSLVEYLQYNTLGEAGVLVPPYTLAFLPESIRGGNGKTEKERFRIFVAGNLMRADHFASLVEESGGLLEIKDIEQGEALSNEIIDDRLKALFNSSSYWQKEFFTARPELQGENMMFVAPTGFGKTELAYLWGAGMKNFMLLPMRAATNKIFDRTQSLYGKDQAALLHGDAGLELFIRSQKNSVQETEGERRKAMDLARHLAKPYIVATADQIVPSALRHPGYERIFSTLMDGALIIDEVQAYDPQAAAIVTHLIQQNIFLGGKTLLMTATLPPFIRKQIAQRAGLGEEQLVNLLELPGFEKIAVSARHRLQFLTHDGSYDTVTDKVVEAAASGQKVLVIMNTVLAACTIYEQINLELQNRNLQIKNMLLHSRFTTARRKELETLAVDKYMPNKAERDSSSCIVVSTQIVEASLDIDADIMFTEPAPADSLVQRMGRVYRRYARSEGLNAPENANVVIIVEGKTVTSNQRKSKGEKDKDARLGSGVGTVYNRDLTAVSLVVLANGFKKQSIDEAKLPILDESPWESCFRKWKGRDTKNINEALYNIISRLGEKSLLINEKQKTEWVEQTYALLDKANDREFPLNLGGYIQKYRDVLEILDHGYCSDKRQDAMRLFRNVNDITGIPQVMVKDFYSEVCQWIKNNFPRLNYAELATIILPKYVVTCPYRSVTKEAITNYHELELNQIIPLNLTIDEQILINDKLERWLSGLVVLELPYDPEKGLNYFAS